MNFSLKTSWHRQQNKLTELLDQMKHRGESIIDLTVTNPTECGFVYPSEEMLSGFHNQDIVHYQPDPRGIVSAREVVAQYYKAKGCVVDARNIFLTASTSEAYSYIFKLLCNGGDSVLVPVPSYPLFDFLAQLNDVELQAYHLVYDHEWEIDIESIEHAITRATKAIIIVHPHNPTGMFLKQHEYENIKKLSRKHHLALIVDEVFSEYSLNAEKKILTTATENDVLTFTLNGVSKMFGLPQMKLGWMVVSGERRVVQEAVERLEIVADTFLSVNTPVQVAMPVLFEAGLVIQQQINKRIKENYFRLKSCIEHASSPVSVLPVEGGWYGIMRVPATKTDEQWAINLVKETGILVNPGYFFDFRDEGFLVVSLLVDEQVFQDGVATIAEFVSRDS